MPHITEHLINKLLKTVREDLEEHVEKEAISRDDGNPIEFDLTIKMGESGIPSQLAESSENYKPLARCYYICYYIGGRRYCYQYCI